MKKFTKKALLGFACCGIFNFANAQSGSLSFLQSSTDDAAKLVEAYTNPMLKGFALGMNSGWYNTAKTHNFLNKIGFPIGFNIDLITNVAIVPTSEQSFDYNSLGLKNMKPASASNSSAPTMAGSSTPGPTIDVYDNNGVKTGSFASPAGTGVPLVPYPALQIGVGFFKNTEFQVRYIPTYKFDLLDYKGSIGMFGVAVKHDVLQYIPVANKLPFDLSVLASYSKLSFISDLGNINSQKAELDMGINAYSVSAIVSKKIALLTVYGGVGYDKSSSTVKMLGTFDMKDPDTGLGVKIKDPINKTIDGLNQVKANLGFRLKFAVVTFQADYTLSKYSAVSAGLGISIGE